MNSSQESSSNSLLPVFFFHGLTGHPGEAVNLERECAAQGRVLVPLSFCPAEKSILSLHKQIPLAIEQIRSIVANDNRFKNGYVFMGHSQGGMLARAVVEEMDDHQVHTLISLAGVQNGIFYGPQPEDAAPLAGLLAAFGPMVMPNKAFDYESYRDDAAKWRGKVQRDLAKVLTERKDLQDEFSFTNLQRAPSVNDWLFSNTFLPKMNNINKCASENELTDQQRRKNNFLRLKAAHFFASPGDGAVAPWQISIFGRYNEVDSLEEIEFKFESFTIVDVRDSTEYKGDTFGLKTLDERGGLHLTVVPNVPHGGWITNTPLVGDQTKVCEFKALFDAHISPALP